MGRKDDRSKGRKHGVLLHRGHEPSKSEIGMRDYASMDADLIVVDESNSFPRMGDRRGSI